MATTSKHRQENIVGAGAAGGSVGTIVAAYANTFPEGSGLRTLLVVGAPLIAVGVSGLWLFVKVVYVNPFVNAQKQRVANAAMDKLIEDARANAARVQADPHSSPQHKREVQEMVEELERLKMEKITRRMQAVRCAGAVA